MAIAGLLLLLLGVGLLGATGALVAACLKPGGAISYLLASALVAWVALEGVVFALSLPHALTRWSLLGAEALVLVVAVIVWRKSGRPRPPALRATVRAVAGELRDPALAVLAAVVAIGGVYVLCLAFLTPAFEWDSLAYHLPRAALWEQQQAVGYVQNATDPRLDGNPPGAEIGILATMLWSGGDRFIALPQLVALAISVLAIAGIARRIGLTRRQALFGSLLFAALPLVAVQAPTTYNDLVVAGFLLACVYGMLGRARLDLLIVALAFGLALSTKLTAVIAVPLLAAAALAAGPARRLPALAAAGAAGLALGAPWYVLNLIETGAADGDLSSETEQRQELSLLAIAPTLRRYLYSFVDFSGSRDIGTYTLYGAVAALVAAIGLLAAARRGGRRRALVVTVGATAVVLLPLGLLVLARGGLHAWVKVWVVLGRRDIADADPSWQLQDGSDAALSWFGPAAAALLVLGTGIAAYDALRRRRPLVVGLLALAPFLFGVVFALLVGWDPWRGRFLLFAVGLAAATWGLTVERRAIAWGVVALSVVALPLTLLAMYTKPSGAPFVHAYAPSVWTEPDDDVFAGIVRSDAVVRAARAVDRPDGVTVALAARDNDFLYPFFGRRQQNVVHLVSPHGGVAPRDASWLVLAPGARVTRCGTWGDVVTVDGWRVLRRTTDGSCPSPPPAAA